MLYEADYFLDFFHFDSFWQWVFFFSGQVNDDVNQSISNLADIPQTIANKNAPKVQIK